MLQFIVTDHDMYIYYIYDIHIICISLIITQECVLNHVNQGAHDYGFKQFIMNNQSCYTFVRGHEWSLHINILSY